MSHRYVSRRESRYPQRPRSWFASAFGVGLGYGCGTLLAFFAVIAAVYVLVAVLT